MRPSLHGRYAHTPYQSNRVLGVLSKMMNLAEVWGMRNRRTSPCDDVRPFPERKRERFLSPEEIERLGAALNETERSGTESRFAVAAFRLLLLTGCRLGEIQRLKWSYVDLGASRIRLPDSKTGAKTRLPRRRRRRTSTQVAGGGRQSLRHRWKATGITPDRSSASMAPHSGVRRSGRRSHP